MVKHLASKSHTECTNQSNKQIIAAWIWGLYKKDHNLYRLWTFMTYDVCPNTTTMIIIDCEPS